MTRLVVVYDTASVEPAEIHTGLSRLGDVTFALPPSAHNRRLTPLLERIADVLPIDSATAVGQVGALRPDAVLTFSEGRVRLTAQITEAIGLPGHGARVAQRLTDKTRQRQRLNAAGVDTTGSARIDDPAEWTPALRVVGLPAVLKPRIGEGSRNTYLVTEATTGERLVRLLCADGGSYVLERYLPGRTGCPHGDYVSVESVVAADRIGHIAVTGKHSLLPPFRERGQFWPARLESDEEQHVLRLAELAVAALGVTTGIVHTEVKLTPDGPRIIEVNGRLGGFLNDLGLRAHDLDLVTLAGRVALGEEVSLKPATPDAVYFQHYGPSLTRAHRFITVNGARQARAVPGITGYRRLMPPNTDNPESVTTRRIDHLYGHAPDHDAMIQVIGEALGQLEYVYIVDDATVTVPADTDWGPTG